MDDKLSKFSPRKMILCASCYGTSLTKRYHKKSRVFLFNGFRFSSVPGLENESLRSLGADGRHFIYVKT